MKFKKLAWFSKTSFFLERFGDYRAVECGWTKSAKRSGVKGLTLRVD